MDLGKLNREGHTFLYFIIRDYDAKIGLRGMSEERDTGAMY